MDVDAYSNYSLHSLDKIEFTLEAKEGSILENDWNLAHNLIGGVNPFFTSKEDLPLLSDQKSQHSYQLLDF